MEEPPPVTQTPLGSMGTLLIVFAALLVLHGLDPLPNPFVLAPVISISGRLGRVAHRVGNIFTILLVIGGICLIRRHHLRTVDLAGAVVRVPARWDVVVEAVPIFGGIDVKVS